jgi:hypothetical protein
MPVRPRHCNGRQFPGSSTTGRLAGKVSPEIPEPGDDPRTGHTTVSLGGGPVATRVVRSVSRTGVLPFTWGNVRVFLSVARVDESDAGVGGDARRVAGVRPGKRDARRAR